MNRSAHNVFTHKLFPEIPEKLVDLVNEAMDESSAWLGPRHRDDGSHDPLSATATGASVALRNGYPAEMGMKAALAHILADKASDRMVAMKVGKGLFGQAVSVKKIFDALT